MRAVFGVAHDGQNASAQTRGDDPVGLGGIHLAQRIGARPIVVVAVDVQFLGQVCEIAELLDLRECGRSAIQAQPCDTHPR